MKQLIKLFQGIKHSDPLKESNEVNYCAAMPITNIERSVNRGSQNR